MGRLLKLGIAVVALWSGWWFIAAIGAERAVQGWMDARVAEGWQAEAQSITRSGYPAILRLRVAAPQLADPATGVAVRMDHLDLSAPAWWPGDVTLDLPETPIRVASPDGPLDLQATGAQALLHLHPGPSLQLETMRATSGPWQIIAGQDPVISGSAFATAMAQSPDDAATYTFDINAADLTPGRLLRVGLPSDWPLMFDAFRARVTVTFDVPWDRYAIEDRRPQPREIVVEDADIKWGALRHVASGKLRVDGDGIPEGSLDLRVENWRQAIDIAEKNGALAPDFRPQAETILGMLSNLGGDPDTLNLTLTFQGGAMSMGPIPLGPAPRIVLR